MASLDERLLEEINAKEDLSLRLGDALDVKASIGLAVIIFLATQTAYFIEKELTPAAILMQAAAILSIIAAAVCALLELWPRQYVLPAPESEIIPERINELRNHYAPYPDQVFNVERAFIRDEMQWAKNRIADNQGKNRRKSELLNCSFWCTAAAVVLNLLTILTLAKWTILKSIF